MSIARIISKNLTNYGGWKTSRKIVVIESDDWGSIRVPNTVSGELFGSRGPLNPYSRFDTLASGGDFDPLFAVLKKHVDKNGNHPVITANTVVGNPDFEKIEGSGFKEYFYEPFTQTLERYYPGENVFKYWQKGMEEKIFFPQYHGREHVNVPYWLKGLQAGDPFLINAFKVGCWALPAEAPASKINLQASYDTEYNEDFLFHKQSIKEGLQLFREIFGYASESFIANNFIWSSELDGQLNESGIKYIQGMKYQKLPLYYNSSKRKMVRHHFGRCNRYGQCYLIRNCTFEPSQQKQGFDSVSSCLSEIKNAFFWKKPAIITTHRLNFIGGHAVENREKNLVMLDELLKNILKNWPDAEFITSVDLGRIIME